MNQRNDNARNCTMHSSERLIKLQNHFEKSRQQQKQKALFELFLFTLIVGCFVMTGACLMGVADVRDDLKILVDNARLGNR